VSRRAVEGSLAEGRNLSSTFLTFFAQRNFRPDKNLPPPNGPLASLSPPEPKPPAAYSYMGPGEGHGRVVAGVGRMARLATDCRPAADVAGLVTGVVADLCDLCPLWHSKPLPSSLSLQLTVDG
jgi:hypothetical protein